MCKTKKERKIASGRQEKEKEEEEEGEGNIRLRCSPGRRLGCSREVCRRCSRLVVAADAGSGNLVSAVADAALINGVRARLQPSSAEIHLIASPISSRRPAPLPKCLPHFATCSLRASCDDPFLSPLSLFFHTIHTHIAQSTAPTPLKIFPRRWNNNASLRDTEQL